MTMSSQFYGRLWVFFNVSYSKDILSAYFVAMKYEETPKRNELLPLKLCLLPTMHAGSEI